MKFFNYLELKSKVDKDLDLEQETIIQESEMMEYCNEGIHLVETVIHDLREDYFLSEYTLPVTVGVRDYDLPPKIFANKIRKVLWNDGTNKYVVRRVKQLEDMMFIESGEPYRYLTVNPSASNRYKFRLFPTPIATDQSSMSMWYLRSANRIENDDDLIDIPEFYMYVLQVMKIRCKEKELLDPQWAAAQLEKLEANLRSVLIEKQEDEDNHLPLDKSFYNDFDSGSEEII